MQEILFRAMGSEIFCEVESGHGRARERLERVPAMFEAWEKTLSRFRGESELSRLNEQASETVRVSDTLWRVLELAERAERWTEGLVTPTILSSLEEAGYDRSFEAMQVAGTDRQGTAGVMLRELTRPAWSLNPSMHTVTRTRGTRLDLGGVAKGWAAEQAASYLGELGAVMVDAGGDMVMTGPPGEGAWHIGIENPVGPEMEPELPVLRVEQGAVATSGRDFRKWTREGKKAHHLIDPRTNLPAVTDVLTATVIAPTIFHAEAAAKVIVLIGSAEGMKWAEAHGDLAVLAILESGKVVGNKQMERFTA